MRFKKHYNIRDVVRFKIIGNVNLFNKGFIRRFLLTYSDFEVKNQSKVNDNFDMVVIFGKFKPNIRNSYLLEDPPEYFIKNDCAYFKDSYKFAKWEVQISGIDSNRLVLRINCNASGYLFVQSYVIDPIIRILMNKKLHPMLHSSCVVKNNDAYLFAARSGVGKTTTIFHFIKKGYKFLGDNWIILNKEKALCCLYPFNIFDYNANLISKKLSKSQKFVLFLKKILYHLTGGYIKIFTSINPRDVFPDLIAESGNLKSVYFMIAGNKYTVKKISKKEMINNLIINNQLDTFPFYKYMLNYSFINPDSSINEHWELLKKNLYEILSSKELYLITVPKKYNSQIFKSIYEIVENERNK